MDDEVTQLEKLKSDAMHPQSGMRTRPAQRGAESVLTGISWWAARLLLLLSVVCGRGSIAVEGG